jgi:Bardet-Biedl syndrome 4 protein
MYLKEFEDAKVEITKALSYHKNDQSFITLGKIHFLQGDTNRAIDVYKQGIV